jgi:hypothetical protein
MVTIYHSYIHNHATGKDTIVTLDIETEHITIAPERTVIDTQAIE